MLKQTVSYFDFDDNPSQETLYFNLTKTELAENLHLRNELEGLREKYEGAKRELTTEDITQLLDLVKTIMRMSYGVRSADGKRFSKNEQLWDEFTQTAAYDAFLFSLFEDPNKAVAFMTGILPRDIRKAAESTSADEISQKMVELRSEQKPTEEPAYIRENREPTPQELVGMTPDEMEKAKAWIEGRKN